jgi:ribosomal protein L29
MKAKFLRDKSKEELTSMLNNLLRERFKYNINKATGEFTKNHLFGKTGKNIARICTIINEIKRVY